MKKEKPPPPERRIRRLVTPDDWYPTAKDGTVEASFRELLCGPRKWRVCVWGDDDFGLERDFSDRQEALRVFEGLPLVVTQQYLRDLGFINA